MFLVCNASLKSKYFFGMFLMYILGIPTRNFGYVSGLCEVCLRYVLCGSSMF